jgi:hypothetical protein
VTPCDRYTPVVDAVCGVRRGGFLPACFAEEVVACVEDIKPIQARQANTATGTRWRSPLRGMRSSRHGGRSSWPLSALEKAAPLLKTFGTLGLLGAKDRKSNARTLIRMNEGSAIAWRHCTSLTQGTASFELAGGAVRTTTAKIEALVPRELWRGMMWARSVSESMLRGQRREIEARRGKKKREHVESSFADTKYNSREDMDRLYEVRRLVGNKV